MITIFISFLLSNFILETFSFSQNLPFKKYAPIESVLQMQEIDEVFSSDGDDDMPIIAESTVKIDDGGSNLTDRFKYKVNALMGTYDPEKSEWDNETKDGNILHAMLTFPTQYAFNIVGRTNGDESTTEMYVEDVKNMVSNTAGDSDIKCSTISRGKNFTKITVEATVESAAMITSIYNQLADHELTIMRF